MNRARLRRIDGYLPRFLDLRGATLTAAETRGLILAAAAKASCGGGKSPITLFSGHAEKIGHLRQPTASATGQTVKGTIFSGVLNVRGHHTRAVLEHSAWSIEHDVRRLPSPARTG
jgi:hypothetical protein